MLASEDCNDYVGVEVLQLVWMARNICKGLEHPNIMNFSVSFKDELQKCVNTVNLGFI